MSIALPVALKNAYDSQCPGRACRAGACMGHGCCLLQPNAHNPVQDISYRHVHGRTVRAALHSTSRTLHHTPPALNTARYTTERPEACRFTAPPGASHGKRCGAAPGHQDAHGQHLLTSSGARTYPWASRVHVLGRPPRTAAAPRCHRSYAPRPPGASALNVYYPPPGPCRVLQRARARVRSMRFRLDIELTEEEVPAATELLNVIRCAGCEARRSVLASGRPSSRICTPAPLGC
jgi:hypothetical protein